MKLDRVLVPLDGSPLAERALLTASTLLREHPAATLSLMRAAQASMRGPWTNPVEAQIEVVDEAKSYLATVADRLRHENPQRPVTTSVWYGQAAPSVVDAADACGADLIVMSTHGRSGVSRLVLGSVAEAVLRATPTPILLVPAAADQIPVTVASHDGDAVRV